MPAINFVRALALTESSDNPNAPLGDHGCALGRWQVHPDWLFGWAAHYHLSPHLNETWDSFAGRVVSAFADDHLRLYLPVEVCMYFHLGHRSHPTDTDWDKAYADRFEGFLA